MLRKYKVRLAFIALAFVWMLPGFCVNAAENTYRLGFGTFYGKAVLREGKTKQLHLQKNGKQVKAKKKIQWKSSDSAVVSVKDGKLKAKKCGNAVVTAYCFGKKVSCRIYVYRKLVKKNYKESEIRMKPGGSYRLNLSEGKGAYRGRKRFQICVSKASECVAVSGKGRLRARKEGSAKVVCYVSGKKGVLYQYRINVCVENSDTSGRLQETEKEILEGKDLTLVYRAEKLKNGDAKFFGSKIITSMGGKLTVLDEAYCQTVYDEIDCNWLDGIAEENVVVYANENNEVGVLKLEDSGEISWNTVILSGDELYIDPAIIEIKGMYYLTVTQVDGNVNVGNLNLENGLYTVKLYSSKDLCQWSFISDVVSEKHNIEDVELLERDGMLGVVYGREEYDKGKSEIDVTFSVNNANTEWTEKKTLVPANADNEPAKIMPTADGFLLYYSSDLKIIGSSYNGADIYYINLDKNFNRTGDETMLSTADKQGKLLYDVACVNGTTRYLAALDYLTDCDLAVYVDNS